jgi:hypothetical protein
MKKFSIFLISLFVFSMFFSSCSSSDDSSSSSSIIGKWNYSKISTTLNGVTSPEMDYDGNEPGCSKDYIEFKTGGIFNESDYSGSTCIINSTVGTWVQTGSTITITEGTDVISAQVVSVSSSELKVKASDTLNGVAVIINISFTKA